MAADFLARGLAAKSWAAAVAVNGGAVCVSSQYQPLDGVNLRPAYQRAITAAAASTTTRRVVNDYGAVAQQVWEPALDDPSGTGGAWFLRNRTLQIPAGAGLDLDFNGARITLKAPAGGNRFPGQTSPTIAGLGVAASGKWLGGFITVCGVMPWLRIANVDVDGGFTGDTVDQDDVNLVDKGLLIQDIGDLNLGAGLGFGTLIQENVVLHGFGGEIMYDNSSRDHFNRDCHYYNSGHSCWNPNGLGRVTAYNLQAGIARQAHEIICGAGHTYHGGRFYKAGAAGGSIIGGPHPTLGTAFNDPVRPTDGPPPFVVFNGTRFEDFLNYLNLGCYMRGSIFCTDVQVLLGGFASAVGPRDIDLDVYSQADRQSNYAAVSIFGPTTNSELQPKNVNLRVHCGRTKLAADNSRAISWAISAGNLFDAASAGSCNFKVDGIGASPFVFSTGGASGVVMPLIDTAGFHATALPVSNDYLYFSADQTYTILSRAVNLFPTSAGTFAFGISTSVGYTQGQRFRFVHDGSGSGDRIAFFPSNGAGMKLRGNRFLRSAGHYLELEWSAYGAVWVEVGFNGLAALDTIQTGTSYTAALSDGDGNIRFTSGSAVSFTIPPNASVPFPLGTVLTIEQAGAGAVSFVAGSGVTLNSRGSDLTLAGQHAVAFARKVATDTWTVGGDL